MSNKKEACPLCKEVSGSVEIKFYKRDDWFKSDDFKEFCKPASKPFQHFSDFGCKGKNKDCANYKGEHVANFSLPEILENAER